MSLVNRQLPSFFWAAEQNSRYQEAMGGFVLDPGSLMPASRVINCAWGADAGTMGMLCDPLGRHTNGSCIPGCRTGYQCDTMQYQSDYCWRPPEELDQMLASHMARTHGNAHNCRQADCNYNEIVLDFDAWSSTLPQGVEAIFFPAGSTHGEAFARRVRDTFRQTFHGLPEGVPPLVRYHDYLREGTNSTAFELVEPSPGGSLHNGNVS